MADELYHTECDCCEHAQGIVDSLQAQIKEPLTDEGWMFACIEARQERDRLRTQLALKDKALADVRHVVDPWTRQGHILLHAGEMKAVELRAVKAVTGCIQRQVNEIIAGVLADTRFLSPSLTDAKTDADPS